MKLLFYKWGAYTEQDLINEYKKLGIKVQEFVKFISDKNHDEEFQSELLKLLNDGNYDAVFSVNYFPVIAECTQKKNIKYISWSYDCPLNVYNIEETLSYETNYVFLFDRNQTSLYKNKGIDTVYHLPLAVATDRYDSIRVSHDDYKKYGADISFLGNMYSDNFRSYIAPLSEYHQGLLMGMCEAQKQVYGYYFLDELLSDSFIDDINKDYEIAHPGTEFKMNKPAMSFAMASNITREERLTLLGLLSKYENVKYYSGEENPVLSKAVFGGRCDYYKEMPKVFKTSKINLNITLKILTSGVPLRALDIMGCGGFLLSNYQPELAEYFVNDEDVVMYESIEDAFEKARFYLKNPQILEKIAQSGYRKVKEQFTYRDRLLTMLNIASINI